jgi:hypothetical protein
LIAGVPPKGVKEFRPLQAAAREGRPCARASLRAGPPARVPQSPAVRSLGVAQARPAPVIRGARAARHWRPIPPPPALPVTAAAPLDAPRQPPRQFAHVAAPAAGHPVLWRVCASRPPGCGKAWKSMSVPHPFAPARAWRQVQRALSHRTSSVVCAGRTRCAHSERSLQFTNALSRNLEKSELHAQSSLRGRVPLHLLRVSLGESQCSRRRQLRCRGLATTWPRRGRCVAALVFGSSRIAFRMG